MNRSTPPVTILLAAARAAVVVPLAVAGVVPASGAAPAQEPKLYRDTKGIDVSLPLGDVSFADAVTSFEVGSPPARRAEYSDPDLALGPPDYADNQSAKATTLGCGGVLVLEFTDNAIADGPGADLHVFEVGPDLEAMELAISADGRTWTELGSVRGGTASKDISDFATPGETYRFVRLTDLAASCSSRWPGADVDAVAAVGGAIRLALSSVVLFDFDEHELRAEAERELQGVVERVADFPGGRVMVEGHTDGVGTTQYNQELSELRATAVAAFLEARLADHVITTRGHGESRPLASNETDEGRQRNRRVEILILPAVE